MNKFQYKIINLILLSLRLIIINSQKQFISLFYNIMNIMNFTQPYFHQSLYLKPNNLSNLSLNQIQINQNLHHQIHKAPENIRKSIKQGKLRKNHFRNLMSEKQRYNSTQIKQTSESPDKNLNQFLINTRKIKNIGTHKKQQISFNDFVKTQRDKNSNFLSQIRKKLIQQAQKSLYFDAKKSLQRNRKLSPLKRGSLTVQKKPQKKQLKITFLNIQKAPLLKMYDKVNENGEDEQIPNKNKSFQQNWNLSLVQTNFNLQSIKKQQKINDLSPTNKLSLTGGFNDFQSRKRKTISQDIGLGINFLKYKKFVPPFERYYYRDFIWKIAYSNGILLQCPKQYQQKFKVFIGRGNNSLLVKSLMKRRSHWWTFTQKYEQANFIWTQIKINQIFKKQKHSLPNQQKQTLELPHTLQQLKKKISFNMNKKILNDQLICQYYDYLSKNMKVQQKLDGSMSKRNRIMKKYSLQKIDLENIMIHNHLPNNYIIGNKKALFYTMTAYYQKMGVNPFQYLPETYHVQNGLEDQQYTKFLNSFYPRQKKANKQERQNSPQKHKTKNIWIVKPGQFTNRGNGIIVCLTLDEIKKILKTKQRHQNGNQKTFIIQSYIDKPFLYQRRKFDIRHYMMITSVNGKIKGYWYEQGYIRTTSYQYSVKNSLSSIHLTNDAVQKNLPDYGKYQKGNKLTYSQFQTYLDRQYGGKFNFYEQIYHKMKKIATDAIRASSLVIDPDRNLHNFQVFGMDFMIDQDFKPWLIQINNNPCLELSCPHLAQIIPAMVQNALKICVDSIIPPPAVFEQKRPKFSDNVLQANKFELVYDSDLQQKQIRKLMCGQKISQKMKQLDDEMDEVFEDDGKQLDD